MDIPKNKTIFNKNIKQFALNASASAILTLHAETPLALPCPIYITDTSLASQVVDFNTCSSFTVGDGGEVGGINMTGYTPTPPSYIEIAAGGTVHNTTGTGINIVNSVLSHGVTNSGVINSHSIGIKIDTNSNIQGGNITNNGILTPTNGTGIIVHLSEISGDITNSGTIEAQNVFVGIAIDRSANVTGKISNVGTIEAQGGAGILVRDQSRVFEIFNGGRISSVAENGIVALNSNTIQGNISNEGVIEGGIGGISLHNGFNLGGNITNKGSITGGQTGIALYSTGLISGNISNAGTISGGQTGILVRSNYNISRGLSNSGNISGGQTGILVRATSNIDGGLSNSGIIQGNINAINISADSSLTFIDILGHNARIIGPVQASGTNVNITKGALFTSEGDYTVSSFNISSNAVFNMANTITGAINNSGLLAISNTLQNAVGNYTQQAGGVFQTGVSNLAYYGQLLSTGVVNLSQSGEIYVELSPQTQLHNGDVLSNIISGSTLIAPTNGLNVNDNSYIWTFVPAINNANNGINLTALINSDAYKVCQGSYCQGAATAILNQVAAGNPSFNPYITLPTADAFRRAASQATPELTNENIQMIQLITRSVLDVAPMWDSLRGQSSGDAMLYQPGKIWAKPYGASMSQNKRNTVEGFDATAYGAVIGKDIQLTKDWLFGGGFAAGGDNMRGKSVLRGQSINSQAYQGIFYGVKQLPNHVYLAGQGLVGYEINDTKRSIPLYESTAKGSYNSWFTNIRAEAGWSTDALSPKFVFTPEVDASYLFINQAHYQESGSLMDLLVASNHNSSLILGAYGNGAYRLTSLQNQQDMTLTGYAGLAGDIINNQPQVLSTFVASGSTFSTFGVQFNGVVFRGGAGLKLTSPTSPLIIQLNYDLQAGNNAYSGIGAATLKYKA